MFRRNILCFVAEILRNPFVNVETLLLGILLLFSPLRLQINHFRFLRFELICASFFLLVDLGSAICKKWSISTPTLTVLNVIEITTRRPLYHIYNDYTRSIDWTRLVLRSLMCKLSPICFQFPVSEIYDALVMLQIVRVQPVPVTCAVLQYAILRFYNKM